MRPMTRRAARLGAAWRQHPLVHECASGQRARRAALLVTLHGARATHSTDFDSLGIDRFLAPAVAAGVPPFAMASVEGGSTSYWHPRADGTDASAMVLDQLAFIGKQFA